MTETEAIEMINSYARRWEATIGRNARRGQALYNGLWMMNRSLAQRIIATDADPYFLDDNIPRFWVRVKELLEEELGGTPSVT